MSKKLYFHPTLVKKFCGQLKFQIKSLGMRHSFQFLCDHTMDQLYCNKIILFFLEINRLQMQATSNYITLFSTSSAHQIFLFYDCTWYIIQINAVKIINAFDSQMTTSHKIETFHFTCILCKNYKFHKHRLRM